MKREVGSLRMELWGAQFLELSQNQASVHDHNGHTNEGLARLGRELCEGVITSTPTGTGSRTSRPPVARRLSTLHNGKFKGNTYLSGNS